MMFSSKSPAFIKHFAFFLLLGSAMFSPGMNYAQEIDSLKLVLKQQTELGQRVHTMLQISTSFSQSNLDSALHYSKRAEQLLTNNNNDRLLEKLRMQKAGIHILRQELVVAEKLLMLNLEQTTLDPSNRASTYHNLGNVFNHKQQYEKAIDNYLKASQIFESLQDTIGLGKVYSNIGVINSRLQNSDNAILYFNKALGYLRNNEPLKMQLLVNLSAVYFNNKDVAKAISTSLEAEVLAKKNNSLVFFGLIYSNLCNFYLEKKEFKTSIEYGLKGIFYKEKFQQNTNILMNNLGYAYLQQGKPKKALEYFEEIMPTTNTDLKVLVLNNIRQAHEQTGNYKDALFFANEYNKIRDSIHTYSQQAKVAELTEQYESEKKQQQIDLLNTKDELNTSKLREQRSYLWILGILSVLLVCIGFLWFRIQKAKQSLKSAQLQQRLLQTQLNPHFLFHALNSIQGYIYENKKEESVSYLSSFSKLMRSILESSDQDFISVEEDVKAIKEYVHLQKLNVSYEFDYQIDISKIESIHLIVIPPMFTQPFVENAILHGFKNIQNGSLKIKYKTDNTSVKVSVEDNGSGFNTSSSNANQLHRSMSMNIIEDRIANLEKVHKYHCKVTVNSSEEGTRVDLIFPLQYKKM